MQRGLPQEIVGTKQPYSEKNDFTLDGSVDEVKILYTRDRVCNIKFEYDPDATIEETEAEETEDKKEDNTRKPDRGPLGDNAKNALINRKDSPYAVMNSYCMEGEPGIDVVTLELDDILPLVGLHGRTNIRGGGIKSLGFIWLDVENEDCRFAKDSNTYDRSRGFMSASEAEGLITDAELKRRDIVEDWLVDEDLFDPETVEFAS